jgi:hypothetical protein
LTQKKFIHDIVAVGSFGIAYEARMMAYAVGRQVKLTEEKNIDLVKTAGPASVVLVTIDREKLEDLKNLLQKPLSVVGEIL